ncbi:hypothetical protein ASE74_02390 [Pedobacter sp. Leaf216]|uniref:hypothetical protein n=1 Tax=Pedobacter sp. Leaf216 TaxID=1735684 RepID=UPI0006FCA974|nr:hypothetical protein [Pedobacter sp. Leaf216]KQM74849.1 hypothetical protein ASE74_02390 [Pedobacter sp. Leaf216]
MKKTLFALLLLFNISFGYSQTLDKKYLPVVNAFIATVKSGSIEKLSAKIKYPLTRTYPIPPIKNKQEFIKRYKEVFDDQLIKKIINSKPTTNWSDVGWRGIMLLNGNLWLDTDGKIIAVNQQSKLEAKEQTKLINADKNKLYSSLANFTQPVLVLETAQYRIRIDDLGNNNYRYASWSLKSNMSEKPSLVLTKGRLTADGSGGNHNYQFKSGQYTYTCYITVLGEEDSPPAQLTITKSGKEILSLEAKRLTL